MEDPLLRPDEITCHRTAHKKLCKNHRDHCGLWMKMAHTNSLTGLTVDEWQCGDIWNTILLTKIIQNLDGVQQATESFRNEMVKRGDTVLAFAVDSPHFQKKIKVIGHETDHNS